MSGTESPVTRSRWTPASPFRRVLAIADEPGDDDDERLRKRVGVVAGLATIVAPLTLPLAAPGSPLSWPLAIGFATFAVVNLLVLARTRAFDRYVGALLVGGAVFVPAATFLGGGITGSSPGLVWAFLGPAYAIMALGPRRAAPWFVVFLATVAVMIVLDPTARISSPAPGYDLQVFGLVQNTVGPLAIVFLLLLYTDTRRRAAERRVDELLTNAIPASIAVRLKHGERRFAEAYPDTTVLFADIAGFTPWAQATVPDRVVELLDDLFTRFDALAATHGLEKIKTIGDAYMAVAGAPTRRADHADAAVGLATSMRRAATEWRAGHGLDLEVRVGLASGPVVAGVIGEQRLSFDLWGETVNLAARMESSGVPGRIQVSASTAALLDDRWALEPRDVDVKGLGLMRTYLVADG
jgi:adenylate cyclase